MKLEPKHWAVIAGLLTGVATQLLTVQHGWTDIATPGFVAGLLIQVATVISAIFVGAPGASAALDRANRNTDLANESTRAALGEPVDLGKVDPKRFIGIGMIVLALGGLVTLPACAIAPAVGGHSTAKLTTPGIVALHSLEVVRVLDVLRDVAIDGEAAKVIATDDARKIVIAHRAVLLAGKEAPAGWKVMALATLYRLRQEMSPSALAHVGPYIDASLNLIKAVL